MDALNRISDGLEASANVVLGQLGECLDEIRGIHCCQMLEHLLNRQGSPTTIGLPAAIFGSILMRSWRSVIVASRAPWTTGRPLSTGAA